MTQNTTLNDFEESQPKLNDPWGFDHYGPTADFPIPEAELASYGREYDPYPLDSRELSGTGLAPGDWDMGPYIRRTKDGLKYLQCDQPPKDVEGEAEQIANDLAEIKGTATETTEESQGTKEYYGIGAGRRKALDAIEAKDHLDDVQTFERIEEMQNAVREISLEQPDGTMYMSTPTDTIEKIGNIYESLPEEAQTEYLNDDILHRRINAARKAFNRWLGKLKREKEMPSPVEAGPSKYPSDKARQLSRSAYEASEELDERLAKIRSGVSGAKQRALEAIGSSVAEQNQQREEEEKAALRDLLEAGQIIQYRSPRIQVGVIHRVNEKSVRIERPNPRYPGTKPLTDDPEPEYIRETVDLKAKWLTLITREDFSGELETLREFHEDLPDDYDDAVAHLTEGGN